MSEKKPFYITTTLPYVNAEPHIGFALEAVQSDVLARYWREKLGSENVFFSTGVDEHGQKIFEAATKSGEKVEDYVNRYAESFANLKKALNLSNDNFIRTTNPEHIKAAQEMWKKCAANGDIYEKEFEGLYCVGCEKFLTQRDLENGKCNIHHTEPQLVKEKNWFFKLSKYQEKLLGYLKDEKTIIPDWRREEAINFVKDGLEDFSISRDKSRLSWGIPVPGDDTQVMYVWFDALTNYISTLGWPEEGGKFDKFWNKGFVLQTAGKDQVRFQSIMWQAMLMSAGVKNTDTVFYHGFVNSGGQKMSKSLGNVISPFEMVKRYGTDATRYLLLRHIHSTEDTDVTWEKLDEWYEAGLVNGLGNLVSRIMKLSEDYDIKTMDHDIPKDPNLEKNLELFEFNDAIGIIWQRIQVMDRFINDKKPFSLIKTDRQTAEGQIQWLVAELREIGSMLKPIMPDTAGKIELTVFDNKKPENLFPRINA